MPADFENVTLAIDVRRQLQLTTTKTADVVSKALLDWARRPDQRRTPLTNIKTLCEYVTP